MNHFLYYDVVELYYLISKDCSNESIKNKISKGVPKAM